MEDGWIAEPGGLGVLLSESPVRSMPLCESSVAAESSLPPSPARVRSRLMERVWSHPDGVAIVFVGTSAEFALHSMADWLFFTGRLPADPVGRFAGTLRYVSRLLF